MYSTSTPRNEEEENILAAALETAPPILKTFSEKSKDVLEKSKDVLESSKDALEKSKDVLEMWNKWELKWKWGLR